jgi:hypothetical protein
MINELTVVERVLAKLVGYDTDVEELSPSEYLRRPKPLAFVSDLVTPREPLDDVQTDDQFTFTLNLQREPKSRALLITDIQDLGAALQSDTTLANACDVCQVDDAAEITSTEHFSKLSYWTVVIVARFKS